jgi:hypothetical protein
LFLYDVLGGFCKVHRRLKLFLGKLDQSLQSLNLAHLHWLCFEFLRFLFLFAFKRRIKRNDKSCVCCDFDSLADIRISDYVNYLTEQHLRTFNAGVFSLIFSYEDLVFLGISLID